MPVRIDIARSKNIPETNFAAFDTLENSIGKGFEALSAMDTTAREEYQE
jgi:hypothetical protein